MKADIQQLLKEVSGQLETLQHELANAQPGAPGTSADPTLYDAASPLEPSAGGTVPVTLTTDEAASTRPRAGGGVGSRSPTASRTAPKSDEEDAKLTEAPREESGATRQPIPFEYRDVFDRLNQPSQPSENTKKGP